MKKRAPVTIGILIAITLSLPIAINWIKSKPTKGWIEIQNNNLGASKRLNDHLKSRKVLHATNSSDDAWSHYMEAFAIYDSMSIKLNDYIKCEMYLLSKNKEKAEYPNDILMRAKTLFRELSLGARSPNCNLPFFPSDPVVGTSLAGDSEVLCKVILFKVAKDIRELGLDDCLHFVLDAVRFFADLSFYESTRGCSVDFKRFEILFSLIAEGLIFGDCKEGTLKALNDALEVIDHEWESNVCFYENCRVFKVSYFLSFVNSEYDSASQYIRFMNSLFREASKAESLPWNERVARLIEISSRKPNINHPQFWPGPIDFLHESKISNSILSTIRLIRTLAWASLQGGLAQGQTVPFLDPFSGEPFPFNIDTKSKIFTFYSAGFDGSYNEPASSNSMIDFYFWKNTSGTCDPFARIAFD